MTGKFALVTGGAGFVGSHIVDRIVAEGWDVRTVDNFSSGRMENLEHHMNNPKVEVLKGDLKTTHGANEVVQDIDVVFHYAANPEIRVSTTNPEIHFNENVLATFNLLEAMRRNDVKELIFASSSSVYGEPDVIPVAWDALIRPVSVYGASKAACESMIHAYSCLYGMRSVVIRYANVVGPRLRHGVVYDFIVKLRRNPNKLEILGDGSQVRSYIFIDDAVEATVIVHINSEKRFEVYNVASEDWITVGEVANIVVSALGLNNVEYVYRPIAHGVGWLGDVKKIVLAIDKIKSLGLRPHISSREAILKTVNALKNELP